MYSINPTIWQKTKFQQTYPAEKTYRHSLAEEADSLRMVIAWVKSKKIAPDKLDPTIRTGKVRIEVENPGIMRLGMFARATFRGQTKEMHTIVPASAVLHMHDRDFVYVPAPDKKFRRVEVVGGDLVQENTNLQEIMSGLEPGQQVVTNALVLDHVLGQ